MCKSPAPLGSILFPSSNLCPRDHAKVTSSPHDHAQQLVGSFLKEGKRPRPSLHSPSGSLGSSMSSEWVANTKCDPVLRGIHAHSTMACGFYPLQPVGASAQDVNAYITATKHTTQAEEVTLTGGAELSGGGQEMGWQVFAGSAVRNTR